MTDEASVAIGIIGAGRIAAVHAAAYQRISGGAIVVCTDPIPAAAKSLSERFGIAVAPTFTDILNDPAIDAVLLATPNALHPEQTIAALKAGKHVFCQKPISLTLEDADSVVAAAKASDRLVQFGFMLRFTPPLPQLRQRIVDGEIGTPIAAQAAIFGWEPTNDWFYDPPQGGGVILDTMVHFADLVTWMFGPARTVYTAGGAYKLEGAKKFGSPDNATVTMRHDSGVVSSMFVSWTAGHGNFTLDVHGLDGSARVDLVHAQAIERLPDPPAGDEGPAAGSTPIWSGTTATRGSSSTSSIVSAAEWTARWRPRPPRRATPSRWCSPLSSPSTRTGSWSCHESDAGVRGRRRILGDRDAPARPPIDRRGRGDLRRRGA